MSLSLSTCTHLVPISLYAIREGDRASNLVYSSRPLPGRGTFLYDYTVRPRAHRVEKQLTCMPFERRTGCSLMRGLHNIFCTRSSNFSHMHTYVRKDVSEIIASHVHLYSVKNCVPTQRINS